MPILDSSELMAGDSLPEVLACDVCIIGTGPAGATIAREMGGSRLRVTVIESGGFERRADTDSLNEIENAGWPRVMDQWLVRNRMVGGSSNTWTGRCAPFDEIDLQQRDWVPHSGWPFDVGLLTPYLDRSAPYLGLGVGSAFSDDRFWALAGRGRPARELDDTKLLPFFWQYSRDASNPYDYMRFGPQLVSHLGDNVTLLTNATVLRVNAARSGCAVESVEFASPGGERWTLAAPTVVICTGGIENARLLLSSDTIATCGLGNQNGLVGRFLMDHPRGTVASFRVAGSRPLQKYFGLYKVSSAGNNLFRHGVRLSPKVQREEKLLNCAAWLSEGITPDDPWNALKRLLRGKAELPGDISTILANAGLFISGLNDYFIERNGLPRKIDGLTLDCICEQRPNPDSRLTLTDRRDRFGVRLPKLDWRVDSEEPRAMRRLAELVVEQFPRMGFEPPALKDWVREGGMFPHSFQDVAHPSGTTRMADDPAHGVVDANGEVHGIHGLFVAGSSTFPTASHCNPTQMIVALAVRLADRLKTRHIAESPNPTAGIEDRPQVATQTKDAGGGAERPLVLVTGASGKIGRHVVSELAARGYRIRALTSKPVSSVNSATDVVDWRHLDFQNTLDFDSVVEGCSAVLHLAAEMGAIERMTRSNVDATRALAEASEKARVKVFCYTSSVSVYGSGRRRLITEESPVLTTDRDVSGEYWAKAYLRAYGRTKLQGERVLADRGGDVEYVALRPTVVVDVPDLIDLGAMSRVKKFLSAHRHAHHIYVGDVADALLWFMERGLAREHPKTGLTVVNLSEDEFSQSSYGDFFEMALRATGDRRFQILALPWQADWIRATLQFRRASLRRSLGRMVFSGAKLRSTGYQLRFGIGHAIGLALEQMRAPNVQ